MAIERYPSARVNPASFGALDVGNLAPLPDGPSLEPGRLVNIHHLYGNELGTGIMEAISIVVAYGGTKANSAVKEAIDATVVAVSSADTGAMQVFNGAIRKASTSTIASAFAFAAWPTYKIEAGTITTLGGLRVYGVQEASGGTVTDFVGLQIDATSLLYTNWYGVTVGAKTGAAGTINAAGAFTEPTGAAVNAALFLAKSATTSPKILMQPLTSGLLYVTVPDSVTSWTLTLPPDDGDSGEQLQTNGSGVTTWEAAGSLSDFKHIQGAADRAVAVARIKAAEVIEFTYRKKDETPYRITTTGDTEKVYTGFKGEDNEWAMHHRGRIFDPVSFAGNATLVMQDLLARVDQLEAKVA